MPQTTTSGRPALGLRQPENLNAIVFDSVSLAFDDHVVLRDLSFTVPKGESYVPIEGPRGEQGFYIVSDGTNRPVRVKSRPPTFLALQALPRLIAGGLIADVIAVIGSVDVVMGDSDR